MVGLMGVLILEREVELVVVVSMDDGIRLMMVELTRKRVRVKNKLSNPKGAKALE